MTIMHLDIRWTDPIEPGREVLIAIGEAEYTFVALNPCNGLDFQALELVDWPEGLSRSEGGDCDSASRETLPDPDSQELSG